MSTTLASLAVILVLLTGVPAVLAQAADAPQETAQAAPGQPNLTFQKFPPEFADYYTTQRLLAKPAEPQAFCKSANPLLVDGQASSFLSTRAILDESGGTGTGYDTLYVDPTGTGDFSNPVVYKVSPQDRKTGLEGNPLVGYFESVNIPKDLSAGQSAHVQVFVEHAAQPIDGAEYLLNMIPAQWAVGTIEINGQPTPVAMVDGNFNDSVVNRRGMKPWYLNQMTPGDDAAIVKSDYIIIGKPGETTLQPSDPNGWLGKTGSARSMNTQYMVTDSGIFEIQQDQTEGGVNLQLVPANVPTATLDLSQVPRTGGRLSLFGTNACVMLDNPGGTVQVPGDTYYVPAFGAHLLDVPAGGNVTVTPPEGFAASYPQGFDSLADREQRLFTQMEPPAGEPGTTGAVRWSQPSADPYAFAAARPGWRTFELVFVAADTKLAVPKVNVSARCYSGGGFGGGSRTLTSDVAGKCVIPLPGGDLQYLSARVDALGYVPAQMFWNPRGGTPLPQKYTWTLEKGTTIGGTVRDERGRPIRGVQVTLESGPRNVFQTDKPQPYLSGLQMTTDARGKWQCKSAPAKLGQVQVGLKHPDYISDESPARPVKAEDLVNQTAELVMKQGILLTGKVTDAKGRPVESAVVNWGGYQKYTSTDRKGRFRIPGLSPGEITLTASAAGFGPSRKKVTIEENVRPVDVKLQAGKVLNGRVIDAAGNGIPLAEIYLQSWQGGTFWWYTKTDAQGRFTWTNAPDDEFTLSVQAEGYDYKRDWHVKPGPQEQVITLKGQLQVTGRVVDAATGAPIPAFTAIPGVVWGPSPGAYWMRYDSAAGKDGAFKLRLSQEGQRYQVRIEAAGYKPAVSRIFAETEANQPLEFALERGRGPGGIVLGVDGQPLADAQVAVGTPGRPVSLADGHMQSMATETVTTGPDGRFTLLPESEAYTVVAVHESGFGRATQKEFEQKGEIRLEAWGRIEGQVRKGTAGVPEQTIYINSQDPSQNRPAVNSYFQLVTDKEGKFLAERVVPGEVVLYREGRREQTNSFAGVQRVTVKAGETVKVTLGGAGRAVTGRFSPPMGASGKIDWRYFMFQLQAERKAPKVPADVAAKDPDAVQKWYEAWLASDDGKASHLDDQPTYCRVREDGTFQLDDVPGGNYYLCACLFEKPDDAAGSAAVRAIGNVVKQVRVPGDDAGDAPMDLGAIELKSVRSLTIGDVAPAFEAKTLAGKTVRLSEHRGKYVLLTFWAGWLSHSPRETSMLAGLRKQYGKDDRFVMVGLNLDPKIEDARSYALVCGMTEPQAHLGDWAKATLPREYGIAMLPSYILIGPEGKIEANHPSLYGVREALTKALGPGADPTKTADSQPAKTANSQPTAQK
jgi:protocatechuate 3,4-dioxygenase beta subunit